MSQEQDVDSKRDLDLDQQIARICGWRWDGVTAISPNGGSNAMIDRDPWWWLPYYSSDMGDAYEVVEHFRGLGWDFSIFSGSDAAHVRPWDVRMFHGSDDRFMAFGETLPLAICRAAIKAACHVPAPVP